jgi:hypothetical protein
MESKRGYIERPHPLDALPERRVTLHSEHMGDTLAFFAEGPCLGRSVTRIRFVARVLEARR